MVSITRKFHQTPAWYGKSLFFMADYEGQPAEQKTMFLLDPSGNALEFKAFRDEGSIY